MKSVHFNARISLIPNPQAQGDGHHSAVGFSQRIAYLLELLRSENEFPFARPVGATLHLNETERIALRGRRVVITVATEQFLFQQAQRAVERARRPETRAHRLHRF